MCSRGFSQPFKINRVICTMTHKSWKIQFKDADPLIFWFSSDTFVLVRVVWSSWDSLGLVRTFWPYNLVHRVLEKHFLQLWYQYLNSFACSAFSSMPMWGTFQTWTSLYTGLSRSVSRLSSPSSSFLDLLSLTKVSSIQTPISLQISYLLRPST